MLRVAHLVARPRNARVFLAFSEGRASARLKRYTTCMRAMQLRRLGGPLVPEDLPEPAPARGQLALEVKTCAICRTDLHVLDGELAEPKLPLILGHQIVGRVSAVGEGVDEALIGRRMGVPWLGWTCGVCSDCLSGRENLCVNARFTGYHLDGGYAERTVADARYAFALPPELDDVHAAPLLCGGLIGYRALRMCGDAARIGLYGFGAAAHLIAQIIRHQGRSFGAFVRPGDSEGIAFADALGAAWAVASDEPAPEALDAAIIFAPVGELVVRALGDLRRGGVVVCAGIHMSDIPSFPYELLWGERSVRSVANLTRRDGEEFLALAPQAGVRAEAKAYPLEHANEALAELREGRLSGAAVLVPPQDE